MPLTVDRTAPATLVMTRPFATAPRRVWSAHTDPLAAVPLDNRAGRLGDDRL